MNSGGGRTTRSPHPCAGPGCRRRQGAAPGRRRRAADGSVLCADCREEFLADLRRLPSLYRACGHALDGSGTVSGPRERTSGGSSPGIPLNTAAAEVRSEILALLGSWAGLVAESRRLPPPPRTVEGLTAFLLRHAGWLITHGAVRDASHEIARLTRRAARVSEPAGRRLITVGRCPEPGCAGALQAPIRPDADEPPVEVRCRTESAHRWAGHELILLKSRMRSDHTVVPAPSGSPPPTARRGAYAASTVWLTASDITRLWGVPSGSVYRLASQRDWRRRSHGGRTRYHETDVVRALGGLEPRSA